MNALGEHARGAAGKLSKEGFGERNEAQIWPDVALHHMKDANPAPMRVTPATPNEGVHTDSWDARADRSAAPGSSTLTPYSGILRSRQGKLRSQHQPEVI